MENDIKCLVAYRNYRNRYFIPSSENYFGEIKVEYIMIDTGCNTTLLPLDNLDVVLKSFAFDKYNWTITTGGGVAALQSPVLTIRPLNYPNMPSYIEVKLANDILKFRYSLSILRFHLSYDMCVEMLNRNIKDIYYLDKLLEFINIVKHVKREYPNVKIGEKRSHALLGQSILNSDNLFFLQCKNICILFNCPFESITPSLINKYEMMCIENIGSKFLGGMDKFRDLEDDDHDIDINNISHDYECYDEIF